eukprot:GILK01007829.1.p1 GENE.GILK01007829.1~~GILK01007829.1.p1  ORF type:complete len:394 (-),score=53.36 GILK01007829.1:143-1324(-)
MTMSVCVVQLSVPPPSAPRQWSQDDDNQLWKEVTSVPYSQVPWDDLAASFKTFAHDVINRATLLCVRMRASREAGFCSLSSDLCAPSTDSRVPHPSTGSDYIRLTASTGLSALHLRQTVLLHQFDWVAIGAALQLPPMKCRELYLLSEKQHGCNDHSSSQSALRAMPPWSDGGRPSSLFYSAAPACDSDMSACSSLDCTSSSSRSSPTPFDPLQYQDTSFPLSSQSSRLDVGAIEVIPVQTITLSSSSLNSIRKHANTSATTANQRSSSYTQYSRATAAPAAVDFTGTVEPATLSACSSVSFDENTYLSDFSVPLERTVSTSEAVSECSEDLSFRHGSLTQSSLAEAYLDLQAPLGSPSPSNRSTLTFNGYATAADTPKRPAISSFASKDLPS